MNIILLIVYIIIINNMNFGRPIYEKSLWMTVFPQYPSPCFSFSFTLTPTPRVFYFYSPQSSSVNRIKDVGRDITSFKTQLSLAPNIYACIAGQLFPSILYNHHYSPQSLMDSF